MEGIISKNPSVLLVLLVLLPSVIYAQIAVRLDNTLVVPHHYNVDLTIRLSTYTVEETVLITLLQDSQEVTFNFRGQNGGWFQTRLLTADGQPLNPPLTIPRFTLRDNTVTLTFSDVIPRGTYTLHFAAFQGQFGKGLIQVPLPDPNKFLITTGFNYTSLRTLLPCFDQPEFRTTYKFTVYHNVGWTLISNADQMTITGPILIEGTNYIRNEFEITKPLSTSSIGLMLTNMDNSASADNRVRVYHTDPVVRGVLLRTYNHLFLAIGEELKVPLEFPKLDVVFAPSFITTPATVTKWGMIAVGNSISPVENSPVHSMQLKEIQMEIARSIYELFFSQLITPQWWSYRWLTAGLATYFSGTSKHLSFDAEEEFLLNSVHKVLREDGYRLPALREDVSWFDQIDNPNYLAIHHKAGAVLRMASILIGRENFTEAVSNFLQATRYLSITSEQFLTHLDLYSQEDRLTFGQTLSGLIQGYELKNQVAPPTVHVIVPGFNEFTLILNYVNTGIDIPIDFATQSRPSESLPQYWIAHTQNIRSISFLRRSDEEWIEVDPDQIGLYRTLYEPNLWYKLINQLSENHTVVQSRAKLIADSLVVDQELDRRFAPHFDLLKYLTNETDRMTWRVARRSFDHVAFNLRGLEESERRDVLYSNLSSNEYLRNRIEKEFKDFERTMEVAKIACASGNEDCVSDVEEYFGDDGLELDGPEDFKYFIYCTLARHSEEKREWFQEMHHRIIKDQSIDEHRIAIRGLGCTADSDLIKEYLEILLKDDLTEPERLFIFHAFLHGSYEATKLALEFIREYYAAIEIRLTRMDELFLGLGEFVSSPDLLALFVKIRTENTGRMTQSVNTIVNIEMAIATDRRQLLLRHGEEVNLWLRENIEMPPKEDDASSIRAMSLLVLLATVLLIKILS